MGLNQPEIDQLQVHVEKIFNLHLKGMPDDFGEESGGMFLCLSRKRFHQEGGSHVVKSQWLNKSF